MRIAAGPLAWCRLYQNTQRRLFKCVALSALPFPILTIFVGPPSPRVRAMCACMALTVHVDIDGNFQYIKIHMFLVLIHSLSLSLSFVLSTYS